MLFVIFLIQLVGSVLAFVYYPVAREAAQRSIRLYFENTAVQAGWDDIQGVVGWLRFDVSLISALKKHEYQFSVDYINI